MKISLNWIKQYVDISLPPKEVADRLTMAGSEVKGLQVIGESWDSIVVGRITAVNPHPNADRLTLVTIDHGSGEETVVCGAPNVAVGVKVAFAPVGARLIDPHTGEPAKLKRAKIRGVVSSGMACSEKELGISEEHEGILILPEEVEVGRPLADYLGDVILNMDITPNRPDCLAIVGIAREVAALTGQSVHLPDAGYKETDTSIESKVSVEIKDPDLCPRYCASLITGVKPGESPRWLQERLISYGMRPISNIVDVTNFVMLEYGQPLHAFDYEEITGGEIIVRRAGEGEVIVSLDGEERTLSSDMLVIADKERAVAVAGVMGGANSEVSQFTTTILLEAASFNPRSIHYTGRILGMPSEACMRFERGISPELAMPALKRATQLIAELGGGQVASGVIDVYPGKAEPEPVVVSTDGVKRVLGVGFSRKQIEDTLISLGFECRPGTSESEVVAVAPYWRSDIRLPVDLVEEVARIIGYDEIPTTMLNEPIPPHNPESIIMFKRRLSQHLVGYGFQEIVSHPWASQESLRKLQPQLALRAQYELRAQSQIPESDLLRLVNPMTIDQTYLRPNLRGNVVAALAANRGHIEDGIRLYELGRVFRPRPNDLPEETEMLCGVLSGPRHTSSWLGGTEPVDFFDAKGVVEGLLAQLGVAASFEEGTDESLHPTNQAAIISNGTRLGVIGQLHPAVQDAFEVPETTFLFEVSLPALLPLTLAGKMFEPISRFPAVVRDMALVVDADTTHQKVVDIIGDFPLVKDVALFDVYSGEQVPSGKKSLAYRISYRSPDHTLTDDEVSRVQQSILNRLSGELGAVLRG
ncbi:MAG TPA: phenylalanine--tRNA ligase subunit beta [Dehalococcoidales bacterium]|nr:phenylalanine--tRNA ligase subunit beta [Dehalococcoidales bacterium]